MIEPYLMTLKETASFLNRSESTIRRLGLASYKIGGAVMFRKSDLIAFVNSNIKPICQSTKGKIRRFTGTRSRSRVPDFEEVVARAIKN